MRHGLTWLVDADAVSVFEQLRSLRKAARARELAQMRIAEIAAARAKARRPLIFAAASVFAVVVAGGGAFLGLQTYRAFDSSRSDSAQTLAAASSVATQQIVWVLLPIASSSPPQ